MNAISSLFHGRATLRGDLLRGMKARRVMGKVLRIAIPYSFCESLKLANIDHVRVDARRCQNLSVIIVLSLRFFMPIG